MNVSAIPTANNGIAIINLEDNFSCFILNESAIVSIALLNAVSPEVIGQATTPNTARAAPTCPSSVTDIWFTPTAGVAPNTACNCGSP